MSDVRTYEELLIERVNKAVIALDEQRFNEFDHIMENTEVLLKIKEGLYELYIKWKTFYGQQLQQAYLRIEKKIAPLDDPFDKKGLKIQNEAICEWGYRTDLLQKLLMLLNDYNLVPFGTPEYAEIDQNIPQEEPPQQIEEAPQPQKKEKSQGELLAEQEERLRREEQEILEQQPKAKEKVRFTRK